MPWRWTRRMRPRCVPHRVAHPARAAAGARAPMRRGVGDQARDRAHLRLRGYGEQLRAAELAAGCTASPRTPTSWTRPCRTRRRSRLEASRRRRPRARTAAMCVLERSAISAATLPAATSSSCPRSSSPPRRALVQLRERRRGHRRDRAPARRARSPDRGLGAHGRGAQIFTVTSGAEEHLVDVLDAASLPAARHWIPPPRAARANAGCQGSRSPPSAAASRGRERPTSSREDGRVKARGRPAVGVGAAEEPRAARVTRAAPSSSRQSSLGAERRANADAPSSPRRRTRSRRRG